MSNNGNNPKHRSLANRWKKAALWRELVRRIWNKQFLIFLFFLALSTTFWVFQALNETYEDDFAIPIEIQNVPSNVVITSDLPAALQVSLKDKGSALLTYRYAHKFRPIVVDFEAYANVSGHVIIKGSDLARQILTHLQPGTQMLAVKPDTLEFYYNYGLCKRVPVIPQNDIRTGRLYSLANTLLSQDSVTVYASGEVLDTITGAYLQPKSLNNLTDTTTVSANFVKVRGAKFVPNVINVTYCIDRMVEKTVQVPVQQVNFPGSKQLRTFPATVKVTFQVGMGQYRSITSNNFVLVVNYEDLLKKIGRAHV